MKFSFSDRFKKDYKSLPKPIQNAIDKQIFLLKENPNHPSLDIKKMRGRKNVWRCKAIRGYRFTLQIEEEVYIFRRVGTHDILNKS
jgi:mRNA-degrading endonuclease RelE of RelBE toxin-antitoxin system